jgi:YrhK-like protein
VWAPDAFGSACFLVASALALAPVWGSRGIPARIAWLNMLGSVFFGIAAIASWVVPDTGELLNTAATNSFTFLGAVCFFAGAWLMRRPAG